jgi:hypothetical protein
VGVHFAPHHLQNLAETWRKKSQRRPHKSLWTQSLRQVDVDAMPKIRRISHQRDRTFQAKQERMIDGYATRSWCLWQLVNKRICRILDGTRSRFIKLSNLSITLLVACAHSRRNSGSWVSYHEVASRLPWPSQRLRCSRPTFDSVIPRTRVAMKCRRV